MQADMPDESSKQITEDQHFVPKFYMKRFADEKGFLKVLNVTEAKIEKPRPYAGVCYEKFYYAIQTGVPDEISQQIEEFFKEIENNVALKLQSIYEKILNYKPIDENERYQIATLAAMLYLRGGYMRAQINRMEESMYRQLMRLRAGDQHFSKEAMKTAAQHGKTVTPEEIESYRKMLVEGAYDITLNNAGHLSILGEMRGFANMLHGKHWIVHLAKGSNKFFTSDTPVVEWIPERTGFYGASFLSRKHYFVLSPEMVIEFVYPISGKRLKRKWASEKTVYDFNAMRLNLSMEEAYSFRANEFEQQLVGKQNPALFRLAKKINDIQQTKNRRF